MQQSAQAVVLLDAYLEAGKELQKKLKALQTPGNIMEVVKTFEDACIITGDNPNDAKFNIYGTIDEIAYLKLKVIAKALNGDVVLTYADPNQHKWYPWFQYSGSGFRFDDAGYGLSDTYAAGGSRLCFATQKLAEYAGKQFIDLYNQFLN